MTKDSRGPQILVPALVGALVAAACSVSSGDERSEGSQEGTDPAPAIDAPARGVSRDAIRLGIAAPDLDAVRERFGVDVGNSPPEALQALVDATNEDGGINGRQVELVVRPFLPVGEEEAQQACRELIEDEEVFAVVGSLIGDTALCVTETYETPYFGNFGLNPERRQRSRAPFITVDEDEAAHLGSSIERVIDEELVEGEEVAVVWDGETTESIVGEQVVGPLEEAGFDVVSQAQLTQASDVVQGGAEMDRILQRFASDGADTVVVAMGLGIVLPALERTSYRPQLIFTNGQLTTAEPLTKRGLEDPHTLDGAIGAVWGTTVEEWADNPDLAECFATINEHSDLDLRPEDVYPADVRPGSKGVALLATTCQLWDLTVTVLDAAGDDPTPASIVDGLDSLDSFELFGGRDGSLGATRWGAGSGSRIWRYDPSLVRFVPADDA